VPFAPVFDLNSPAPGYTTSLPQSYDFSEAFAVQNDNVTVDLNGNGITTSALNVATTTGQTGSLILVGPGNIDLSNGQTGQSANLDVGDQGGTGQLTVNDATITNDEDEAGHFDANGLLVENGGTINLLDPGNNSISNGTFNHSSLTATNELNANQIPSQMAASSDAAYLPSATQPSTIPPSTTTYPQPLTASLTSLIKPPCYFKTQPFPERSTFLPEPALLPRH
jgi:hypothetical protein